MPLFAQLPMLNSDSLCCFCPLLILQHDGFLLSTLVCTQETAAYVDKIQNLSFEMRSRLRHNNITVLIIGKPNTHLNEICLQTFVPTDYTAVTHSS